MGVLMVSCLAPKKKLHFGMAPSSILNSHLACTLPLRTLAQLSGPFPIIPMRLASRYTWSRKAMQSVMTCFGDPSDKSQISVECDVSHGMLSGSTGSPSRCSLSRSNNATSSTWGILHNSALANCL